MKIVLIGAFGHQGYVTEGVKELKDATIVAVAGGTADEDVTALSKSAEKACGRAPKIYRDWREMLDRERPNVAGVSPMFCLHQPVSVECLRRDISVICEKPVAFDLGQLKELKAVHAASRGHFIGMHAMRYHPDFLAGRNALQQGLIGRPILINSQKSYSFDLSRPQFYKERSKFGGTLCWVASHAIDWTYWMMGPMDSIFAAHSTLGNQGYGSCESSGVIAFAFKNGGQGCVNFDFLKARKDPMPQDRCRIAGEKGVIEIRYGKAVIETHDAPPRELELPPHNSIFKGFVDRIQGVGECLLSAEDTFEVTRLCLLARQSADTKTLIRADDHSL